ncbi:MAG TPA: hypothetical protein VHM01_11940 [Alphaproteobacteria bacterium]|nr:hypothetical protein [Alphaproteobacteria bacterium]
MNATRRTEDDFGSSRPVLSADSRRGGGLLSGLLQAIMPSKGKAQRAEPTLGAARSNDERREPYLFGQRRPTPGTAD